MKKVKFLSLILCACIMIAGFQFSTFAADAPEDSWDWDIMEWSIVDAVCCMPYGLELNCDPINFSCYEDGTYGRHVTSVSQVTDDVDYIARTIFAEVINVSPRVKNAFCVAQIIENRVNSSSFPSTAKGVVSQANQFGAVGTQAFCGLLIEIMIQLLTQQIIVHRKNCLCTVLFLQKLFMRGKQ